jgi:hypothetical protein
MAKECTSLGELLELVAQLVSDTRSKGYDLGKTNYFTLIPSNGKIPKFRDEFAFYKWRFLGKNTNPQPRVEFQIDRLWVTMMVHVDGSAWIEHFPCKNEHPVELLRRAFV